MRRLVLLIIVVLLYSFTAEEPGAVPPLPGYPGDAGFLHGQVPDAQHRTGAELLDSGAGAPVAGAGGNQSNIGEIRDYLQNKPRERLKITVFRDGNVTLGKENSTNASSGGIPKALSSAEPASSVDAIENGSGL